MGWVRLVGWDRLWDGPGLWVGDCVGFVIGYGWDGLVGGDRYVQVRRRGIVI